MTTAARKKLAGYARTVEKAHGSSSDETVDDQLDYGKMGDERVRKGSGRCFDGGQFPLQKSEATDKDSGGGSDIVRHLRSM